MMPSSASMTKPEPREETFVGPFDHVVVGDDETILGNDEARST
jgi:hypothetical protein